jgi:hypothetical protein
LKLPPCGWPTTLRTAENHDRRNTSLTEQADGASATRSREFPRLNVTYCPLSQHWLLRPARGKFSIHDHSGSVWHVTFAAHCSAPSLPATAGVPTAPPGPAAVARCRRSHPPLAERYGCPLTAVGQVSPRPAAGCTTQKFGTTAFCAASCSKAVRFRLGLLESRFDATGRQCS